MKTKTEISETASGAAASDLRLMSVDVLRGFDMFWIIGADSLAYALQRMAPTPVTNFLAYQLEHADWQGFHFYDLVFPLFIFIVGVSIVFSISKTRDLGRKAVLVRILRRSVLLFLLGIFYSGGLTNPWPDVRLMGVLNRIALVYCFTAILFAFFKPRILAAVSIGLLAGYWALLAYVPMRDIRLTPESLAKQAELAGDSKTAQSFRSINVFMPPKDPALWDAARRFFYGAGGRVAGKYEKGYNVADHLDFQFLPGRKYEIFYDPEGLLSSIPSVATCLFGVFAGLLLRSGAYSGRRKVLLMVSIGIAATILGWIGHFQIPVVKKIWTPSYALVAGGYCAILLGVFYLIVDVWRVRKWCKLFVWIGMNSIAVYMASNIMRFRGLSARIVGGDVSAFLNRHIAPGLGDMMVSLVGLLLAFWFAHFLYKRKIFIKI